MKKNTEKENKKDEIICVNSLIIKESINNVVNCCTIYWFIISMICLRTLKAGKAFTSCMHMSIFIKHCNHIAMQFYSL